MQASLQNDKPGVTRAGPAQQVKNPCKVVVADDKRRGNEQLAVVLARVYRIILAGGEGRP